MNILFLVDGWYPGVGGAEMQATLLARALQARGHRVAVVAPRLDPGQASEECHQGLPVRRIDYWHLPRLSGALYMIALGAFLWRERAQWDAIHIHMVHKMATVVALMRGCLPARVLAKVSGATEFENGVFDLRRRRPWHRWQRRLLMRIERYQVLSGYSERALLGAGAAPSQLLHLPNAIEMARFSPASALHGSTAAAGAPTRFVFCGRLTAVKRVEVIVAAAAALRAAGVEGFVVELYGDGDRREALEAEVAARELGHHVRFHGRVEDVAAALDRAHAYVQVSRYEGLSNAVLEALCSGLPAILTRISGNEDWVESGRNGYLIEVDDHRALAAAMARLIDSRALCRRMGADSRQRIARHCALAVVIERLERAYAGDRLGAGGEAAPCR